MRQHSLWLSAFCLLVGWGERLPADESSKGQPRGTTIAPDPVPLKPGGGLSVRTPVVRPGALKDVRSWTIETRRHRWAALTLALSPDATLVATSGYDGTIHLWDAQTGLLRRVLVGHDSYVYGLAWSADGRYLASTGSFDYTVRVWEAHTGLPVKVLKGLKQAPLAVAWSPDGSLLAAGTIESGDVSIWRAATGAPVKTVGHGKTVLALAFSPDGEALACGVAEVGVNLLSSSDWTSSGKIDLAGQQPRALSYSADGKQLVVGSDKHLVVWDVTGKKVLSKADGNVSALARHGNRLAVAASPGQVWDLDTGKGGAALPPGQAVGWSGDGKAIYLLSGDEVVRAEPAKGAVENRWGVAESGSVWWFPGRPILTGVGTSKPRLWEATTGKLLHALEGHTAATTTAAWFPGGKFLATGGHDKTVRVWNPATGKLVRTLAGFEGAVTALAVAGDGKVAAGSADGKLRVFTAEGKPMRTFVGHTEAVKALAWARDGRLASGGVEAAVRIWRLDAGKPVRSLEHAGSVECLAFAPNGKWLAAGASEHRVSVWSYPAGKVVHEFSSLGSPPAVTALAWGPDSNSIHAGRGNHTAQLWDLKLGKDRGSLAVLAPVQAVAWSAAGKTRVTCTSDRSVRFWNTASGRLQATVIAEPGQLCCVAAEGHYRAPKEAETELAYVVLTKTGMDTYAPRAFAAKFGWKNDPTRAKMVGR